MEAYKTQNKFLNCEIYQLTKLWRKSSEQERSLMVKVGLTGNSGNSFCYWNQLQQLWISHDVLSCPLIGCSVHT